MDNIYFVWQKKPVEIEENLQLPQFKLQTHFLYDCVQNYTAGVFPCLEIKFLLRRDFGYFFIQIYVPSMLVVILSWVSFWLNIEASPARVSIGLLTVLTITTQNSGINASLPRVSYIKAVDVWMSMCLIFVFAGLLEYALVNVLSRKKSKVVVKNKRAVLSQQPITSDLLLSIQSTYQRSDRSFPQSIVTRQPRANREQQFISLYELQNNMQHSAILKQPMPSLKDFSTSNNFDSAEAKKERAIKELKAQLHESLDGISDKYKRQHSQHIALPNRIKASISKYQLEANKTNSQESPVHYHTLPLNPQRQNQQSLNHTHYFHPYHHYSYKPPQKSPQHNSPKLNEFKTTNHPGYFQPPVNQNLIAQCGRDNPNMIRSTLDESRKQKLEYGKEKRRVQIIDGVGHAKEIDKMSRKLFPFIFLLFNLMYWMLYAIPYIQSATKDYKNTENHNMVTSSIE